MTTRLPQFREPRRQGGIVLLVALIAMLLLSLAGIALVRTVDTNLGVAGNLGFRQTSMGPVNQAIEIAILDVFKAATPVVTTADDAAHNYFSEIQLNESRAGVPLLLQGDYATVKAGYPSLFTAPWYDNISGTEVRWVVERMCNGPAVSEAEIIGHCDILPPKVPSAGTDNKCSVPPCLKLPPIPVFRITARADVLNTNAVSFAQAFVK